MTALTISLDVETNPIVISVESGDVVDLEVMTSPVEVTIVDGLGIGNVTSVNNRSGAVILDTSDIFVAPDYNYVTDAELEDIESIDAISSSLSSHISNTSNPHNVTKTQVGLSNVDNTSDLSKPISTATQTALDGKEDSLGYSPENIANKSDDGQLGNSTSLYPTQRAVKEYVDGNIGATNWGDIGGSLSNQTDLNNALDSKVNTVPGKQLSTNDFSNADKTKLDGIQAGAEVNVNADWNSASGDSAILNKPLIPTELSELLQDSNHRTVTDSEKTLWNSKEDSLGFTPENIANKNQNSGYAGLDSLGKISISQLPAIAVTDTFVVNSQSAMLALVAEKGDVCIRQDLNKSYILVIEPASVLSNWEELLSPTDQVQSVFGRSGVVTAQTNDYTWNQIDKSSSNISDITNRSHASLSDIGSNTHPQIDSHISSSSNPHNVTKSQVGLSNVDNTSDLNKPISTATQSALDEKISRNTPVVAATKTKISYDEEGLVVSGADATTQDIAPSTDRNYVTDSQLTIINNTSGINTGDQNLSPYFNKTTDDLDDINEGLINKQFTSTLKTKLDGIEDGAQVNNIGDVDAGELVGGLETSLHSHPGLPRTGEAILDFLSGENEANVVVTGQTSILSSSAIHSFFMSEDFTADHTQNDHRYAPMFINLACGSIVAGSQFTINATSQYEMVGQYKVRWVWY